MNAGRQRGTARTTDKWRRHVRVDEKSLYATFMSPEHLQKDCKYVIGNTDAQERPSRLIMVVHPVQLVREDMSAFQGMVCKEGVRLTDV